MGIINTLILSHEAIKKVKHISNAVVGGSAAVEAVAGIITGKKSGPNKIMMPRSAAEYEGLPYLDVIEELKAFGFTDFGVLVEKDIKRYAFFNANKPETVKSIAINGNSRFTRDSKHWSDSKITITYHDYMD